MLVINTVFTWGSRLFSLKYFVAACVLQYGTRKACHLHIRYTFSLIGPALGVAYTGNKNTVTAITCHSFLSWKL